jgi:hypothetical protein
LTVENCKKANKKIIRLKNNYTESKMLAFVVFFLFFFFTLTYVCFN